MTTKAITVKIPARVGGAIPQSQLTGLAAGGRFNVAPIATPFDASIANAKANLYTPAQLRNQANQQTNAQINAALNSSTIASKAEQAQFGDLASRAAGIAAALGSFGAQYGANDQAAYNQAANTIGQLGTGLTGAVASDWNSNLDASKAAVANTLGGQGQVASYDPGSLQSTAQYLGVTMPGTTLAQQALNAKSLGEYGAVADMADAASVSQDYIAQAKQALDQRNAERAQIVAQRPELYQTALQAQRQDNIATQNHIDSLVTASTNYLQNQQNVKMNQRKLTDSEKAQAAQIAAQKWGQTHMTPYQKAAHQLAVEGVTGVDANGNPIGQNVRVTMRDGQTAVVPYQTAVTIKQNQQGINQRGAAAKEAKREFDATLKLSKSKIKAQATNANKIGTYDQNLSAQVHHLVDSKGRAFVDANNNTIPFVPVKKPGKSMSFPDTLKIRSAMTNDATKLAKGYTDPKTNATTDPVPLQDAINSFNSLGYFQGKLGQYAVTALATAYGLSPDDIIQGLAGYDPATGSPWGEGPSGPNAPGGQPPPVVKLPPDGSVPSLKPTDPRTRAGKAWDPQLDPIKSFIGTSIMVTASGHEVDASTHRYLP